LKSASKNTNKMSQDILADALNGIRNAKKARKEKCKNQTRFKAPN